MKLRTYLAACSVALALTGAVSAQSMAPGPAYGGLPPNRIAAIARAAGFDPLFRPMRLGSTYVLRALDRNDLEYRLVIDAYTGRTISVRATGARGGPGYGPQGGPVYGRIFGPADEQYDDRYRDGGPLPPRAAPHPRPVAPQTAKTTPAAPAPPAEPTAAQPSPQSTQQPLPRPRPYVMESTSSIPADAPKAAPQPTPPPAPPQAPAPPAAIPAPPADTPHNNGGAAMPPVAPLD
jgi:hypothetical protein